jgi:hypothetical protein
MVGASQSFMLASGRFRGPSLLVAVLSRLWPAMLALILFAPDAGDPLALVLTLRRSSQQGLGLVWTKVGRLSMFSPPDLGPAAVGGAPNKPMNSRRAAAAGARG